MRLLSSTTVLLTISSLTSSLSVPTSNDAHVRRKADSESALIDRSSAEPSSGWEISLNYLEKRRGGGGSSGGGGGGSSGGGGGGRSGRSSAKPSYGGGKYFGGGATRPYSSGTKSPRAGIVPLAIGIGAAAFIFPGIWIWGAYNYPYNHGYSYRNRTRRANNTDDRIQRRQDQNVTLPITCLCEKYSACGCDDNEDTEYLDSIIGDGTNLNESLVHIGPDENGQQTIALNGTLPNATDSQSDTSSGSSSTSSSPSSSAATTQRILESSGIWVIGAIVGATVWLL
ncbi:MAG: hypothetical protein Q9186_007264 [Xanthomendoza sp. 1 TL-2023]